MKNNSFKFIEIGHLDKKNKELDDPKTTLSKINNLIRLIKSGKKVFLFIFMQGCGHCEVAKPEWVKLKNLDKDVVIVSINENLLNGQEEEYKELKKLTGKEAMGYPTFKYIDGSHVEEYEDGRDFESFKKWIQQKSHDKNFMRKQIEDGNFKQKGWLVGGASRGANRGAKKITKRRKKTTIKPKVGGKWSLKYKRSINCKKPKGFSQKQYCKYSRKNK
jgi:thiol-disulfide isomerase/thioredoxin